MTKFVFSKKGDRDTVYLDGDRGNYEFPNYAEIDYVIDRDDKDVQLTIGDYSFDVENLDTLIEFLQAIRKEIA